MKSIFLTIGGVLLLAALSSHVDADQSTSTGIDPPSNEAVLAAERLMEVTGDTGSLKSMGNKLLAAQLQSNSAMKPYENAIKTFVAKYLAFEHVQPRVAQLYMDTFSAEEMEQLTAFYKTPLGQKTRVFMQSLNIKAAQISTAIVEANLPELQSLIEAEALRLKSEPSHNKRISESIQREIDEINKTANQ